MEHLHFYLQLLCAFGITGFTLACSEQQKNISGVCCDKCAPGFYLENFCSDKHQTICKPCAPGFFSARPSFLDLCEKCRSCEQGYSQNCTPTTDAKCFCDAGFLCSDNTCSKCVADKCERGERLKRTDVVVNDGTNRTKYTYECEPLCQSHEYYNEKKKVCILLTVCSTHGLVEIFAGNKTHDVICQSHEMQKVYMIVIVGFVLLIITIMVIFFCVSAKKIKKIKASQSVSNGKEIKVTTIEFCPLSMEETAGPVEHKEDSFG